MSKTAFYLLEYKYQIIPYHRLIGLYGKLPIQLLFDKAANILKPSMLFDIAVSLPN